MQQYDYLATVCYNIIRAQGIDQPSQILVGAKLMGLLAGAPTPIPATPSESSPAVAPTPEAVKENKVILKRGGTCACMECNRVIFDVVTDIYDSMKVGDFINAFAPRNHDKRLTTASQIQNIDGIMTTDCVLCGAIQSLYLIGYSLTPPVKK